LFGIAGVLQLVFKWPHAPIVATSIAVLFFISVYANVVGHWSSQQASKVERRQEEAIEEAVTND
jgi:phosphate/sulfate permease